MRIEKLPIMELLPIENTHGLGFGRIPEIINKVKKINTLDPITVIPYISRYIVWDGSGRTTAHLLAERNLIDSVILETDLDLKRATRNIRELFRSILGFQQEYATIIKPELESYGIYNFADYPVFKELCRRGIA